MAYERIDIAIRTTGGAAASQDFLRLAGAAGTANTAVRSLLGVLGTTSVFLAAGMGVRAAISQLTEFERAMSAVRAISGATGDEFEMLTMRARELGGSTVFTATQAAEGLKFFAQAGFSVQESMQAIGAALDLAIVGMTDLGTASDITANVIRGFNLDAAEAARVADVLAFTASSTNTNVEQAGKALSFVAPVARALGVSLEDTSVAIGVLSDAGLKAERAGTGLRGVFQKLVNPTKQAAAIIESYGVSLDQVNPATVGFTQAIKNLSPVLAGPNGAANAMAIFMQRAGPAALILNQLSGRFDELQERIKESEGTAKEMAAIMQDNLWGAAKILTSALTETVLQLGDAGLAGTMKTALQAAAKLVQAVNGTLDPAAQASEKYYAWAKALKGLAAALGGAGVIALLYGLAVAAKTAIAAIAGFAIANPFIALALGASALLGYLVSVKDELFAVGDAQVSLAGLSEVLWDGITRDVGAAITQMKGVTIETDVASGALRTFLGYLETPTSKGELLENIILSFTFIGALINEAATRLDNFGRSFDNFFIKLRQSVGLSMDQPLFELREETTFDAIIAQSHGATRQLIKDAETTSKGRLAAYEEEQKRRAALREKYDAMLAGRGGVDPNMLLDIEEQLSSIGGGATSTMVKELEKFQTALAQLEGQMNPYVAALQDYEKNTLLVAEAMSRYPEQAERWVELQGRVNDAFNETIKKADEAANKGLADLRTAASALHGALDPSVAITTELNKRLELLAQLAASGDAELMKLAETLRGPVTEAARVAQEALVDPRTLEGVAAWRRGFMEGFSGLGAGVNNEFEIVKNGVASVFSTAGSAIEEFVTKGTGDIRELSRSIIAEVGKAVAKLILLRVLQSASGLADGGGLSGFLGQTAQSFLTLPKRATGGPAGPGKPFLVGERGPEIFTPPTAGTVSPLSGAGFTPQVNVQVVNVTDPDEIPRLMQSREGQQAILNTLSRNPQKARAAIG